MSSQTVKVIPEVIPICYALPMAQKIGPKGQVVIPKSVRDHLGVRPGDEVVVTLTENGALVQAVAGTRSMKGIFAGSQLLEILEQDHRAELE